MQKVLDILERYCQWIAVGIGAVFFLFAMYQYLPVVTTPVTASLGEDKYAPGSIDHEIVQSVAEPLESKMASSEGVKITVPNYASQVTEQMNTAPKVAPLSPVMSASMRVELPELPWDVKEQQNVERVAISLPIPPVATLDPAPTSGFAQVTSVVASNPPGNPATPAPAGGTKDVTWVRVPFSISMAQMDREFKNANIPGALTATNFVRVELIRQKKTGAESWGPDELIAPIETAGILPVPNAQSGPGALISYNQWAIQHQQQIVQPPFYPFVAGDHPFRLSQGTVTAPTEGGAPAFDPETFPPPPASLEGLTPEQKKAVNAVRQRRAKEAEEARRQQGGNQGHGRSGGGGRGAGGPGGGGGGGYPGGRSDDHSGHGIIVPFGGEGGGPGAPGGPGMPYPPGYPGGGYPGGGYPGGEGGYPGAPPTGEMNLPPVGNQTFIPQAGMADIQGYAFDLTAKAGSTYRYRIRYSIANPLFNAVAAGVNPQLAAVYELVREDPTKWTEAVTVKSNTHIFLQSTPNAAGNIVRFTIFHWQNGKWNRANQTFSPGDSIGKPDGDVDYRSNFTLVEVRKDSTSEHAYVLVMNDDGSTQKRDYDADKDSQEFKDLTLAVDGPPAPPTAPEGGGYPGGYPGGGYPGGGYPGGGPGGTGGRGPMP